MKYVITESKLINFVDKYIADSVGRLRKFPVVHINAREDDFKLVQDNGRKAFVYSDYHLEVDNELFDRMMALFNLDTRETEKLLEKWFEKNYPGNMVITAYRSIY
jgi:hypothetical protein